MIDLGADDAAKVSAFHSLWVGKAGGELLRGSPPLSGASVLSASRLEPLVYGAFLVKEFRHAGARPSSVPLFDC